MGMLKDSIKTIVPSVKTKTLIIRFGMGSLKKKVLTLIQYVFVFENKTSTIFY